MAMTGAFHSSFKSYLKAVSSADRQAARQKQGEMARDEEAYEPTEADKAWLRNLLNHLHDGGMWGWPNANLSYSIDKTSKVATVVHGNQESRDAKIGRAVWHAIGWRVKTTQDRL